MGVRSYPRMDIMDFGAQLIVSGDLDPIYQALHNMQLPTLQLHRWLLSYWCFYSAGVASYLSEAKGTEYWDRFLTAAVNTVPAPHGGRWERGKERRHFRGKQALQAANELMNRFPQPEYWYNHLVRQNDPDRLTFETVSSRVKEWRGFGDWISFKVADMLDRCGVFPVDFRLEDAMYKDPTQAALIYWKVRHGAPADSVIDDEPAAVLEIVNLLIDRFRFYTAPPLGLPWGDRNIGFTEIETILCKWKSHIRGHYPLFNDIDEINHGTKPWVSVCDTARRFAQALPQRPQEAQ